jgi:murein DD-endopeptidase MepM/ murein hydrolase activator NlpD
VIAMKVSSILFISVVLIALMFSAAEAQTPEPSPEPTSDAQLPVLHVVQEGETLFTIAELYSTTIESLQLLNNIDDPSLIFVGQEINLPGAVGQGVSTIHTIQLGDSLESLAAGYRTTPVDIAASNWLIYGKRLVVGKPMIITSGTGSPAPETVAGTAHIVKHGDTILTIAAQYGLPSSILISANGLPYPTYLYTGQRLRIPADIEYQYLPGNLSRIKLFPLALSQGKSAAIYLEGISEQFEPAGQFAEQELHFAPAADGYIALVGIDAFTEPGIYSIELTDQTLGYTLFDQNIAIDSANYGIQSITIPAEKIDLLAPEIRQNEDAFLATIYNSFEPEPLWAGTFTLPISNTVVTASYGDARSYNDGPIEIYHTGVDFSGGIGTKIFAPAPGTVVLSQTLTLRGNSLVINHGLGVMTGYYHLSNILVEEGDSVTAGQVIAEGGSTGLSSGPHLHWDLRIHDVTVDPIQWTIDDFLMPFSSRVEQPSGNPTISPV